MKCPIPERFIFIKQAMVSRTACYIKTSDRSFCMTCKLIHKLINYLLKKVFTEINKKYTNHRLF